MMIHGTHDLNLILLVTAVFLSVFAAVGVLVALLKDQLGGQTFAGLLCFLLGTSLTLLALHTVAALNLEFYGDLLLLLQLLCFAGFAVSVWVIGAIFATWRTHAPARNDLKVWGIGIVSVAIGLVCTSRIQAVGNLDVTLLTTPELPGEIKPVESHYGLSDRGRRIALLRFSLKGDLPPTRIENKAVYNTFTGALIQRKDVDVSANCHGWVFAGGDFLLDASGVTTILEDNEYARVNTPREGDIAVYRNSKGDPIHTAIVCTRFQDGSILVESKWGIHQRFVHLPEQQPYSTLIEYYRSPRTGHTIQIRKADGSDFEPESVMGG